MHARISVQVAIYELLMRALVASPQQSEGGACKMPNVHGIEFNANQSELVKDLVRELLKDGNCAVYALNNMKPNGELRMATTPPTPKP